MTGKTKAPAFFLLPKNRWAVLLFFLSLLEVRSQHLVLKNFNVKDGLPSSEVYCAMQDSKGFIWFGTDGGVSRFDGYSFRNFTVEEGMADNTVFGINEDRHGRIWFRSLSGKLCYVENDTIHRIGANELISRTIKSSIVISMYIDSGDTVWCGARGGPYGLIKINPGYTEKDISFVRMSTEPFISYIEGENFVCGNSTVGKSFVHRGLYFFKKEKIGQHVEMENFFPSHFYCASISHADNLLTDNFFLYHINHGASRQLIDLNKVFHAQSSCLKRMGKYVWLGLLNKGLKKIDPEKLWYADSSEIILDGLSVSDVMEDSEGGTWFTTLENGIYYTSSNRFISYFTSSDPLDFKSYSMQKISPDHLFISNKPGIGTVIGPEGIIEKVLVKTDKRLAKILEKALKPFTLITTGNAYQKLDLISLIWSKEMHRSYPFRTETFGWAGFLEIVDSNKFYTLDRYWIYTWNKETKKIIQGPHLPTRVLCTYMDKSGILWLGSVNGLWSFNGTSFTHYGNEHPFLQKTIEDIEVDADGTWYFATRGSGIFMKKNSNFSVVAGGNKLPGNCKCLLINNDKSIWTGTQNGLYRLVPDGNNWKISKFMINGEKISREISKIEQIGNTLWLLTNNGLLSYDMSQLKPDLPPRIFITQFDVKDKSFLKQPEKNFAYDANSVKIAFVGLSYRSEGNLSYEYRLEGADTAWHKTRNTFIQYPFLPPGDYVFSVRALSMNGTASAEAATIHFIINKPFWKRTWFILILIALVFAAGYLVFYLRLKSIHKKEMEKAEIGRQLSELEMKALRAQMNPHFMFNAINSIQYYIVKNDSKTARVYLAKFARLIRNVLENSRKEYVLLENDLAALKLYIDMELLRMPGKFRYEIAHDESETYDCLIPPLLLQPYVENAILHGISPLPGDTGMLLIHIKTAGNKLICIIDDNGIGRKKASELKQSKASVHQSLGLSVTEERLNLMGNLNRSETSILTEDKSDEQGHPAGTKITLTIPLLRTGSKK